MSLIILVNDLLPKIGGVERYIYELGLALQDSGEEIVVITTECPGAGDFDAASRLPIVRVPGGSKWQTACALSSATRDCIHESRFSEPVSAIIAARWRPSGVAAWLVCRSTGLPYVVMAHDREVLRTGSNILKWLAQHLVVWGAAGGLAVSHYAASCLQRRGLTEKRLSIIYAGVNPEAFTADEEEIAAMRAQISEGDRPILLTVARLVAEKGHSQVIAALPQIMDKIGEVDYVIAGTGPEEEKLHQLVQQRGLSQFVHFLGRVSDEALPALYRTADIFIMTSRDQGGKSTEGFGLVYLEAGICELPVIGSRTGGIPDAIADGEVGLLVDGEDPREIAEAIVRLASDKDIAAQMGQAGRRRVLAKFTWARVAQRVQQTLSEWNLTTANTAVIR